MYLCIYVSIYLCMYVCMYLCIYVSMYLCIYVSMYLCIYVSMYLCMYVCMYVAMYLCIYVCMYLCTYVCMYVRLYVCTSARLYVSINLSNHDSSRILGLGESWPSSSLMRGYGYALTETATAQHMPDPTAMPTDLLDVVQAHGRLLKGPYVDLGQVGICGPQTVISWDMTAYNGLNHFYIYIYVCICIYSIYLCI